MQNILYYFNWIKVIPAVSLHTEALVAFLQPAVQLKKGRTYSFCFPSGCFYFETHLLYWNPTTCHCVHLHLESYLPARLNKWPEHPVSCRSTTDLHAFNWSVPVRHPPPDAFIPTHGLPAVSPHVPHQPYHVVLRFYHSKCVKEFCAWLLLWCFL